ncbi:hypothetical protein Scep_024358 [Stephania cephalantha]|uniref:Uncharacterized protein n=1 Tax=Stephania cephalantha TaxID=152367 RepID=A0AAP0F3K2_9MAGN
MRVPLRSGSQSRATPVDSVIGCGIAVPKMSRMRDINGARIKHISFEYRDSRSWPRGEPTTPIETRIALKLGEVHLTSITSSKFVEVTPPSVPTTPSRRSSRHSGCRAPSPRHRCHSPRCFVLTGAAAAARGVCCRSQRRRLCDRSRRQTPRLSRSRRDAGHPRHIRSSRCVGRPLEIAPARSRPHRLADPSRSLPGRSLVHRLCIETPPPYHPIRPRVYDCRPRLRLNRAVWPSPSRARWLASLVRVLARGSSHLASPRTTVCAPVATSRRLELPVHRRIYWFAAGSVGAPSPLSSPLISSFSHLPITLYLLCSYPNLMFSRDSCGAKLEAHQKYNYSNDFLKN